jgi:hypothetical protein
MNYPMGDYSDPPKPSAAKVNLRDTLERIRTEWRKLGLKCSCDPEWSCSVCEITYLLAEAP